ncbi:hypothetical protein PGTUg99_000373 [Puccinia graminis f. sp. tritici]|uniref:Vesicle tethering protein Uso1/P115-like head domain-containing protein n=1 Tax=Puccinia graminis f. sp. tritici TaxID=56615 RepID=A0A5B0RPN6_PUCGR|nr:hypothetical protein PGTUg99_000373 [Puccinia graminis f. sp. tritici]
MMAQRMQSQSNNAGDGIQRSLAWARIMVGYLMVLATWFWESPATTSEFLSEGTNLQVESFTNPTMIRHRRYRGRSTLQPILHSRVGPDQFVNRILRLREDPRFKNVGPDVLELCSQGPAPSDPSNPDEEPGLWFDWPFVEFLKNNYGG